MNEAYTKLMLQQHTSPEADAAFFEKLENTKTIGHHRLIWKAAIAAACILLLIPVTVLAVNYIFHKPVAEDLQYRMPMPGVREFKDLESVPMVGFEVTFDDMEHFSIKDFPKEVQSVNNANVSYDSWASAADDLDIGLLKNTVLSDADTSLLPLSYSKLRGTRGHCEMEYIGYKNQPFIATIGANYSRYQIEFSIRASLTIDHTDPVAEEYYGMVHKYGQSTPYRYRPNYTHEDYTTSNDIPVSITRGTLAGVYSGFPEYIAVFAVNNISYCVSVKSPADGYDYNQNYDEDAKALLLEILEGFTLE